MYTIKPKKGLLFCKSVEVDTTTKSGFLLASTEQIEPPKVAVVINAALGSQYKAGDRLVYKAYHPEEVEIDKVKFLIVDEDDVLGEYIEVTDAKKAAADLAKLVEDTKVKV